MERGMSDDRDQWRTNETDFTLKLANKVLDNASLDPDGDMSVLARQFLRLWERLWQLDKNWLREMTHNVELSADLEFVWDCLEEETSISEGALPALREAKRWILEAGGAMTTERLLEQPTILELINHAMRKIDGERATARNSMTNRLRKKLRGKR